MSTPARKKAAAARSVDPPKPDEIAARAAEIRKGWKEVDYYRRAKWVGNGAVEIQVADIPGCDRAGANI